MSIRYARLEFAKSECTKEELINFFEPEKPPTEGPTTWVIKSYTLKTLSEGVTAQDAAEKLKKIFLDELDRSRKLKAIREKRDALLNESDYMVLPDVYASFTNEQQSQVLAYRQKLRDITTNTINFDPVWPEKPKL